MLPKAVTKALCIIRPRQLQVQVTDADEDATVVQRPDSQLALTSSYRYRSLLISAARYTDPKLGMEHSRYKKKSKTCVRTTPKISEPTKMPLETRAGADGHYMKEEDVVDKITPAASSNIRG